MCCNMSTMQTLQITVLQWSEKHSAYCLKKVLKSVPVFSSVYKIKVRNVLNTFMNLFLKFHLTLYVFKYKVYVMNCLIISKTGHTCQKKAIDQYH